MKVNNKVHKLITCIISWNRCALNVTKMYLMGDVVKEEYVAA